MKKIFLIAAMVIYGIANANSSPTVDGQVLKNFKSAFPLAEKPTWYENNGLYEVVFENNQVKCRVWYEQDGKVKKTERYYTEKELPLFIIAKVKERFNEQKIYGVTEVISAAEGMVYHIVLNDDQKWYHIQSDSSGNVKLNKKYTKG
ncbi:MAG: hypothetical protein M3413_04395 [Bacteroidota bacterium]|nr:hypothetical protein [Bacteroidota bacterium]